MVSVATFGFLLSFALSYSSITVAGTAEEYKIETAFIYQFTNYIDWPELPLAQAAEAFVITVFGETQALSELEDLAKTKKVKTRQIKVYGISEISQLKKSNIIFITSRETSILQKIAEKAKGSHALLISHTPGFAKKGAMINFYNEEGRLRFELNQNSLKDEKLNVSSQLLKLAKLVE